MDKQQLLTAVGTSVIEATRDTHRAIINTAKAIAAISEAKLENALPLMAGDKDMVPALAVALNSGLATSRDMHKAQVMTFQVNKRVGGLSLEDMVPACPCVEGLVAGLAAKRQPGISHSPMAV